MLTKPWPIILLAVFYFIAPLPSWLVSAHLSHRTPIEFLQTFESWSQAALFFLLFPVAGFAIFMVKRWSYFVFGAVMAWSFYMNLMAYYRYPTYVPLWVFIAAYVINIALVGYFLIPAVREVYRNPRLRWWEAKPRYEIATMVTVNQESQNIRGTIHNISVGGVFLEASSDYAMDSVIELQFLCRDIDFSLKGKILYKNPNKPNSFGVQFQELTRNDKQNLKSLVEILEKDGVSRRPERWNWRESLLSWLKTVLTSGKGLVPEIPEALKKK